MRKGKSIFNIMALLFVLILANGCADLRTKTVKKNPDEKKGLKLLKEMAVAHGIANWESVKTYTVNFEDEFYGKMGEKASPFAETNVKFKLQYIPKTFDGRIIFDSGKDKGLIWGIQSWETYTSSMENMTMKKVVFEKHKDAYFWTPTYQYFIEFPMRIQEATAVSYAGQQEINGKLCEGVIASWNTTRPQKKTDQYLIWIDSETKRIEKLDYTIREVMSFVTGVATFKDYKNYNGILLPSIMSVGSNLVKDGLLHEMRILDFNTNEVSEDDLRPSKELSENGDRKLN